MADFFHMILDKCLAYVSRYRFFITGSYYEELLTKYFSVAGFIIGFIFVLLIIFSSGEDQDKAGFFKVLPLIAVINSCGILMEYLTRSAPKPTIPYDFSKVFDMPDNLVAGFILILVITSCYREYHGHAFVLGLTAFAAMPMMMQEAFFGMPGLVQVYYLIEIVLAAFLCVILSYRKTFYSGWIWFFGFRMLLKLIAYFAPVIVYSARGDLSYKAFLEFDMILSYLSSFTLDYIIFAGVLFFAIIFDRGVVNIAGGSRNRA